MVMTSRAVLFIKYRQERTCEYALITRLQDIGQHHLEKPSKLCQALDSTLHNIQQGCV